MSTSIDSLSVHTISFLAADAVEKANSGHPGMPMGCADLAYILFHEYLETSPDVLDWPNRDRFILSAGHGSMLQYALLHLCEFDVSLDDLKNFRQLHSKTPGHPEVGHTQGVEATTGPLGQGTANAVGMSLASKMMADRFTTTSFAPIDHQVYAIVSDGDLMEGISSESASLAGHLKLSNLIYIYDDNNISIDGSTDLSFTEDVAARYTSYGWHVETIDGHNHDEIRGALDRAKAFDQGPCLIVAKTHIGHGAPNKQDTASAHGAPLGQDELEGAKKNANWPIDTPFLVPDEVRTHFQHRKNKINEKIQAWQQGFSNWQQEHPELYKTWQSYWAKPADMMETLIKELPTMPDATRSVSNKVQQTVAREVAQLVGGSADLACSCKTLIKDAKDITAEDFSGRNIHFGIREYAMGAVANGMALYGSFVPYTSTFLVFSDYMRPAIRMAALSNIQTLFVFTHDSLYVGEDGPTHQPVEQIPSLRLIPNHKVFRPCNAMETAASWNLALQNTQGPSSLILTRQKLADTPILDADLVQKGGYIISKEAKDQIDATFIATGSEVALAIEVQQTLQAQGKSIRVVSIPCLELFSEQDSSYINNVLPEDGLKVAIEAAQGSLWYQWVGQDGIVIDMQGFGTSAPGAQVAKEFGFDADHIIEVLETSKAWLDQG